MQWQKQEGSAVQTQRGEREQMGVLGRGCTCTESKRVSRNRANLGIGYKNIQGRKIAMYEGPE